jgi:hypothetical protein
MGAGEIAENILETQFSHRLPLFNLKLTLNQTKK